jgi:hypothetical protein
MFIFVRQSLNDNKMNVDYIDLDKAKLRLSELKESVKRIEYEIDLIESLIKLNPKLEFKIGNKSSENITMVRTRLPSKGNGSWNDYIILAMDYFKRKNPEKEAAKAHEIADLIKEVNPDIADDRVIDAVRNNLLRLIDDDRVIRIKSENKREGYTYKINEKHEK